MLASTKVTRLDTKNAVLLYWLTISTQILLWAATIYILGFSYLKNLIWSGMITSFTKLLSIVNLTQLFCATSHCHLVDKIKRSADKLITKNGNVKLTCAYRVVAAACLRSSHSCQWVGSLRSPPGARSHSYCLTHPTAAATVSPSGPLQWQYK